MQGITKTFHGSYANKEVSLKVEQGEIHSLLGENGAGKTTLMKILFGLYKADKGRILINGSPPSSNKTASSPWLPQKKKSVPTTLSIS